LPALGGAGTAVGIAAPVGLLLVAVGISVGLQKFISRRRDRLGRKRRPHRRLANESPS
jgi:hypothetical protein